MTVEIDIKSNSRQARTDLRQLERSLSSIERSTAKSTRTITRLGRAAAIAFAALPVVLLGRSALKTAATFEVLEARLITTLGTVGKASDAFKTINTIVAATPFSVRAMTDAFARFANAGIRDIPKRLQEVADATAAIGGGDVEFTRIAIVLERINSEGRVTAERLNQLADLGLPLTQIAKGIDGGVAALRRLSMEGNLTAEIFSKLFSDFVRRNAAGAAARQVNTLNGAVSNFNDALAILYDRAIRQSGFSKIIVSGIQSVTRAISRFSEGIEITVYGILVDLTVFYVRFRRVFQNIGKIVSDFFKIPAGLSFTGFAKENLEAFKNDIQDAVKDLTGIDLGDIKFTDVEKAFDAFIVKLKGYVTTINNKIKEFTGIDLKAISFKTILESIKSFRDTAKGYVDTAINKIKSITGFDIKAIDFSSIKTSISGFLTSITPDTTAIAAKIKSITGFDVTSIDFMKPITSIKNLVSTVKTSVGSLNKGTLVEAFNKFKTFVTGIFSAIFRDVIGSSTWTDLIDGVKSTASSLKADVTTGFNNFKKFVTDTFEDLSALKLDFTFDFATIRTAFQLAVSRVFSAGVRVGAFVVGKVDLEKVKTTLETALDNVLLFIGVDKKNVDTVATGIKTSISSGLSKLTIGFIGVREAAAKAGRDILAAIEKVLGIEDVSYGFQFDEVDEEAEKTKTLFQRLLGNIKLGFTGISDLGVKVTDAIISAINGITSANFSGFSTLLGVAVATAFAVQGVVGKAILALLVKLWGPQIVKSLESPETLAAAISLGTSIGEGIVNFLTSEGSVLRIGAALVKIAAAFGKALARALLGISDQEDQDQEQAGAGGDENAGRNLGIIRNLINDILSTPILGAGVGLITAILFGKTVGGFVTFIKNPLESTKKLVNSLKALFTSILGGANGSNTRAGGPIAGGGGNLIGRAIRAIGQRLGVVSAIVLTYLAVIEESLDSDKIREDAGLNQNEDVSLPRRAFAGIAGAINAVFTAVVDVIAFTTDTLAAIEGFLGFDTPGGLGGFGDKIKEANKRLTDQISKLAQQIVNVFVGIENIVRNVYERLKRLFSSNKKVETSEDTKQTNGKIDQILDNVPTNVRLRAEGGAISGPGTGTSDSILARLSNGEYVINADSTKKYRPLLEAINSGTGIPGFNHGGYIGDDDPRIGPTLAEIVPKDVLPEPGTDVYNSVLTALLPQIKHVIALKEEAGPPSETEIDGVKATQLEGHVDSLIDNVFGRFLSKGIAVQVNPLRDVDAKEGAFQFRSRTPGTGVIGPNVPGSLVDLTIPLVDTSLQGKFREERTATNYAIGLHEIGHANAFADLLDTIGPSGFSTKVDESLLTVPFTKEGLESVLDKSSKTREGVGRLHEETSANRYLVNTSLLDRETIQPTLDFSQSSYVASGLLNLMPSVLADAILNNPDILGLIGGKLSISDYHLDREDADLENFIDDLRKIPVAERDYVAYIDLIRKAIDDLANNSPGINIGVREKFQNGGYVSGPGTGRSDSIPARLSNGEFVVNAASTRQYLPLLEAINGNGMGPTIQLAGFIRNALGDPTLIPRIVEGFGHVSSLFLKDGGLVGSIPGFQGGGLVDRLSEAGINVTQERLDALTEQQRRNLARILDSLEKAITENNIELRRTGDREDDEGLPALVQLIETGNEQIANILRVPEENKPGAPGTPTGTGSTDPRDQRLSRTIIGRRLSSELAGGAREAFRMGIQGLFDEEGSFDFRAITERLSSAFLEAGISGLELAFFGEGGLEGFFEGFLTPGKKDDKTTPGDKPATEVAAEGADKLNTSLAETGNTVSDFFTGFIDGAGELLSSLGNGFLDILNSVGSGFGSLLDGLGGILSNLGGGAGDLLGGLFGSIGSLFGGGADLPVGFNTGGPVDGEGTSTSDSIVARLSKGEFVVNALSARKFRPLLQAINSGNIPGFQSGGPVGGRISAGGAQGNPTDTRPNITNINISGNVDQRSIDQIRGIVESSPVQVANANTSFNNSTRGLAQRRP